MSAIEQCRSAALGGHVERCEDCGHSRIAYNSCRNRHCPKCQGAAATDWLAAREADLLPVGYFHVVFTLPAKIAPIAYQNKAVVYDLLLRAAAETLLTIAADPKHLGARIGATAVLHSWGAAMTHHPHVHQALPAPRPAQAVSSHPPLRAVGQRRLQGQHCACQGADGCPNAGSQFAGSTRHSRSRHYDRSSPAVPLLRRPHDHCRGLCARMRTAWPALVWRRDQDLIR
jgi:hypothetical protein